MVTAAIVVEVLAATLSDEDAVVEVLAFAVDELLEVLVSVDDNRLEVADGVALGEADDAEDGAGGGVDVLSVPLLESPLKTI